MQRKHTDFDVELARLFILHMQKGCIFIVKISVVCARSIHSTVAHGDHGHTATRSIEVPSCILYKFKNKYPSALWLGSAD